MQYKIYTLQHQKLYDQIHSISNNEKNQKIVNKETLFLLDRCKEIRKDYSILSKVRELDALFSDVLIMNKKTTYSYEHIIIANNKIYVLERKKSYDNQRQLLKEKTNYLKKCMGKNVEAEYFILLDTKTNNPNYISLEKFIDKYAVGASDNIVLAQKVNEFIISRHVDLNITTYIQKKYNININYVEKPRTSSWIHLSKFANPLISKYKGTLSFLSSMILFFYLLCAGFTYSIYAKDKQFLLSLAFDGLFLFLLTNVLKEIESKCPKILKYFTLLITLLVFIGLFVRIVYYI